MVRLIVLEHNLETTETQERTFEFTSLEDATSATALLMWLTEHSTHDGMLYESALEKHECEMFISMCCGVGPVDETDCCGSCHEHTGFECEECGRDKDGGGKP